MSFKLEIVTPDGLIYDNDASKVIVRTTEGDVGILERHSDYVAALSIGLARIFTAEGERRAACAGGMVSVSDGVVRIVASTFEWAEDIDVERALKAKEKAQAKLQQAKRNEYEYKLAEVKLKRSLARLNASGKKD